MARAPGCQTSPKVVGGWEKEGSEMAKSLSLSLSLSLFSFSLLATGSGSNEGEGGAGRRQMAR